MNDKDLFDLEVETIPPNKITNKKIKSEMNKYILPKILKTLGVFILSCILIISALSLVIKTFNYNPTKSGILSQSNEQLDFDILMSAVSQLYFDDAYYYGSSEIIDHGFSNYTINTTVYSTFDRVVTGISNTQLKIQRSNVTNSPAMFNRMANLFVKDYDQDEKTSTRMKQDLINEIRLLPDSTRFYVSISLKEPIDLATLFDYETTFGFQANYITTNIVGSLHEGFSVYIPTLYELSEQANEQYPNLFELEKTVESYTNHYTSLLKLLIRHKDFTNTVVPRVSYTQPNLNKRLSEAEAGIAVYGYKTIVDKQTLISIINDDNTLSDVIINDVSYSRFEK
ncbi:MAG: hypothetical protein ACRC6V_09890 [Bacteroidales bacterium]